ncbi:MAG: Sau3AI family type II restriction endonuclease [Butyrivibrio hungatei]|nr:Sau3AI family type II restriction endonuclease [Butyrivibrio hungatei]
MSIPYDDADENSIYDYSTKLLDKTFNDILVESEEWDYSIKTTDWSKPKNKGRCGNLLEERFYGYPANSIQEPDFPKAQVELKVTPIDILKNGDMSAGERLVLTMISFNKAVEDDFYESPAWHKCRNILLVHYIRDNTVARFLNRIKYVSLFKPQIKDRWVFERDYAIIIDYIKRGKAEELSESLTNYIGACTKGIDASKTVRQFYPPHSETKTRAYCFKRQYMQYVLDVYIRHKKSKYECIIEDEEELKQKSFEDIVIERMQPFMGKGTIELCKKFEIPYNPKAKNNKAVWNSLVYRILGIKGNHAEEFVKAGIVVKVSRVEADNTMDENISFPAYKFTELVKETWDDCNINEYFSEKKFFWVTFKYKNNDYYLDKVQFWSMPYKDLQVTVKKEWLWIQGIIKEGVTFRVTPNKIYNNIPGEKQTEILHSRPKADKAAYHLKDGTIRGDVEHDAEQLPDGQYMTRQCFWLNKAYIAKQLGY